jgi:hypothetical protein
MTVVAGASLLGGVLLTADSRGTYPGSSGTAVVADNLQKVVVLAPRCAVGYAGNVLVAGELFRRAAVLLHRWYGTRRLHTTSLLTWLPRFLAHHYSVLRSRYAAPQVYFILAGVIPGRPNIVERARVVAIMERFRLQQLSMQRNWLPGIFVRLLMTPPDATLISVAGQPTGVLCTMTPPAFLPTYFPPLSAIAIGSGKGAIEQIDHYADWVFAGDVGNSGVEGQALREAVRRFAETSDADGIGGLYPTIKVAATGCELLTFKTEIPLGGARIELSCDANGRFEQHNHSTGKSIPLKFPWEVGQMLPVGDQRFDDLDEAERRFRGHPDQGE